MKRIRLLRRFSERQCRGKMTIGERVLTLIKAKGIGADVGKRHPRSVRLRGVFSLMGGKSWIE